MLPNFIVIGAERCGTTSLHRYLDSHPQVFMSRKKELDFFVAERNWRRGRRWYERQFPTDAPIRGESSPAYTAYPLYAGVPARLAALVPAAKLLYIVRDPVERAISALHLARALGHDHRPEAEALSDLEASPYVARSRYAAQLEQYIAQFPDEAIAVVDSGEAPLQARRDDAPDLSIPRCRRELLEPGDGTRAQHLAETPTQPRRAVAVGDRLENGRSATVAAGAAARARVGRPAVHIASTTDDSQRGPAQRPRVGTRRGRGTVSRDDRTALRFLVRLTGPPRLLVGD